jgi:hypothetical protein
VDFVVPGWTVKAAVAWTSRAKKTADLIVKTESGSLSWTNEEGEGKLRVSLLTDGWTDGLTLLATD